MCSVLFTVVYEEKSDSTDTSLEKQILLWTEGAAFTDGKRMINMDDQTKILTLLARGPQDARELARKVGIPRNPLFSLLMKMEKEGLIEWKGQEWTVKPSRDSKQNDLPDSSHQSEGGSDT